MEYYDTKIKRYTQDYLHNLTHPRSRNERFLYVGLKVIKEYARKPFRKYVSNLIELLVRWDMYNTNLSPSNFFTDNVDIHFYVFSALMLNGITGKIYRTYIVTVY